MNLVDAETVHTRSVTCGWPEWVEQTAEPACRVARRVDAGDNTARRPLLSELRRMLVELRNVEAFHREFAAVCDG